MVYVPAFLDRIKYSMKICVIIPSYNEAKTIAAIIKQVSLQGLDVIVVDDGSTDNTFQIAGDNKAFVLRNGQNEGKGASLVKGFNYALTHNYDAAITIDGDGQHDTVDIPHFIRAAAASDCGILIGNRMHKPKDMPMARFLANKFMSFIISHIVKQNIPDSQCGFRLIKKEVLEKIRFETNNYDSESELLLKASRLGLKIGAVPIDTIYRGEKSRINPFVDALRFIRLMFREGFR